MQSSHTREDAPVTLYLPESLGREPGKLRLADKAAGTGWPHGGTASFRVHVTAARGHNDNRAIIIMLITSPERKREERENEIVNMKSPRKTKGVNRGRITRERTGAR